MLGSFKLYIVATPIGNLADITFRALDILKQVPVIVCEDTRQTKKILDRFGLGNKKLENKKLISLHQHSDASRIVNIIKEYNQVAYVSDAGTPGISDPGGKIVEEAIKEFGDDIEVIPIPGASAVIAALSISGMPTDRFEFKGFIPHKKGREKFLKEIEVSKQTVVFYESVHRIIKLLKQIMEVVPNRKLVIAREVTKKFESLYRGTASEILEKLNQDKIKGEFVVVVEGEK